ncbi:transposase [Gemmatimonas sp.]|jgi:hypothetical protein|uniref:transposase n=1 Tax=Gemmatimonas sp. TaxID=1962908 RepID=UPI0037C13F3B
MPVVAGETVRARVEREKVYLTLDNLNVHKAKDVRVWLAAIAARIAVFDLLSYSLKLNPDEYRKGDLQVPVAQRVPARDREADDGDFESDHGWRSVSRAWPAAWRPDAVRPAPQAAATCPHLLPSAIKSLYRWIAFLKSPMASYSSPRRLQMRARNRATTRGPSAWAAAPPARRIGLRRVRPPTLPEVPAALKAPERDRRHVGGMAAVMVLCA